jgi:hypothetical protein
MAGGDLLGRPALVQTINHEPLQPLVPLEQRQPLATGQVRSFREARLVAARRQSVARQLTINRRRRPPEPPRHLGLADPFQPPDRDLFPLLERQMPVPTLLHPPSLQTFSAP